MRRRLKPLDRFLVTPTVSKHRTFSWLNPTILADHQLVAFARSDDYFFGVLQSRVHELWSRSQGTQVRERESGFRYTPTTCFETFPFPEPTEPQREAIAQEAKRLDELRSNWLNPPEWTREEVLEFPGSVDGPWTRYVHDADDRGIGTVRYPRRVAKDAYAFDLAKRTLTNLYNERPTWLDLAHRRLDEAVFAAYGWSPSPLRRRPARRPAGAEPRTRRLGRSRRRRSDRNRRRRYGRVSRRRGWRWARGSAKLPESESVRTDRASRRCSSGPTGSARRSSLRSGRVDEDPG